MLIVFSLITGLAILISVVPCIISYLLRWKILLSLIPSILLLAIGVFLHYSVAIKPEVDWGSAAGAFLYYAVYESFFISLFFAIILSIKHRKSKTLIDKQNSK